MVFIHDDLTIVGPVDAAFDAIDKTKTHFLLDIFALLTDRGDLQLRPDKRRVVIAAKAAPHAARIEQLAASRSHTDGAISISMLV